jgi:putative transcriptional regulator
LAPEAEVCETENVADSLAGRLLLATPALTDPNFARAVVLLCAHDSDGAFGIVLNRSLAGLDLAEHVPAWAHHCSEPAVLFAGGPVDGSVAIGLARYGERPPQPGEVPLPFGLALIDLSQPVEEPARGLECLRVFVGYSGWGAGQLEREIEEEAWFVVELIADDPFFDDPDRLWRHVLQRQSGRLAMFAYFPPDPTLN